MIRVGTAGWTLPRAVQDRFPGDGAHLVRYAGVFAASEINSSFHRSHRRGTYERWAASVPEGFRFCVKLPKAITHVQRLVAVDDLLASFWSEVAGLGERLGCVLVQLPPSFAFGAEAAPFFGALRGAFEGSIAVEPRHATWFEPAAEALLERHRCARVAADPPPVAPAAAPGGWRALAYWRLHGAPRMYYSPYAPPRLDEIAQAVIREAGTGTEVWCMFDNTASGAAAGDALALRERLGGARRV